MLLHSDIHFASIQRVQEVAMEAFFTKDIKDVKGISMINARRSKGEQERRRFRQIDPL